MSTTVVGNTTCAAPLHLLKVTSLHLYLDPANEYFVKIECKRRKMTKERGKKSRASEFLVKHEQQVSIEKTTIYTKLIQSMPQGRR